MMEQGWVAECQNCPTTIGGYGEQVKEHAEYPDKTLADAWADMHCAIYMHQVDVRRFERIPMDLTYVNTKLLKTLFGETEQP